jgi:hypothetical protein
LASSSPPLRPSLHGAGRGAVRPIPPGPSASPGSVPPPSLPSNALLAGGSLEPPRVSSGAPIVQAMPIPVQDLLDEPFASPSDAQGLLSRASANVAIPSSLQPGDAVRALATLVRTRYSGAVAVETTRGIQRAVLRDGDFVTAASGLEAESLVAFLVQRGVLNEPAASNLVRRVPSFGRHAGAALIAHGYLRQDELWPVLRAHAEWILGRMLTVAHGAASLEPEVPVRLKSEPAVFGGATGAEVFVEIVRRVVSFDVAVQRLGGIRARFGDGVAPALLGECALPDHEQLHVNRARSASLEEVLAGAKAPDFAAVLYALVELGVLDQRPSNAPQPAIPSEPAPFAPAPEKPTPAGPPAAAPPAPAPTPAPPPPRDELDDDTRRAQVAARLAVAMDGDYFAVLGLPRTASAQDVRRAHGELTTSLDPGRILTARTIDLQEDLAVVLEVLDEACEILSDDTRRDRYLRAIETTP